LRVIFLVCTKGTRLAPSKLKWARFNCALPTCAVEGMTTVKFWYGVFDPVAGWEMGA